MSTYQIVANEQISNRPAKQERCFAALVVYAALAAAVGLGSCENQVGAGVDVAIGVGVGIGIGIGVSVDVGCVRLVHYTCSSCMCTVYWYMQSKL